MSNFLLLSLPKEELEIEHQTLPRVQDIPKLERI